MKESETIKNYFEDLDNEVQRTLKIGNAARSLGLDPESKVDIPIARNMAERVQGLISVAAPELTDTDMPKRIQELEKEYGNLDWRVALKLSEEVAKEKFCKFEDKIKAIDIGIRVGFAYLTLGIVSAPLEGFIGVQLKKTKDNKEYFSVGYAGPVRGAGGTAAATSALLADYIRVKLGYAKYDPTENEINRYVTEIRDYQERVTNLQYYPSEDEIRFLIKNIPIEIAGDPTEKIEVSNYKDLPRIESNLIRGGMCLVLAEGIAQKAPKMLKRMPNLKKDLGFSWEFLEEFIKLQKQIKARTQNTEEKKESKEKILPNYTFIADLVAGRPVLSHPMTTGGFRLRYGRSRTSGYSAASANHLTLLLLNRYIATGTQLKVERPGKATAITPNDLIEGPIVKLENGNVLRIENEAQVKQHLHDIKKILFLGDILFSYGDFSENGHILVPAGYCEEWWIQHLEKATVNLFGSLDTTKLSELTEVPKEIIDSILKNPFQKISFRNASLFSQKLKIPLHPFYTYHWKSINKEELSKLMFYLSNSEIKKEDNEIKKIIIKNNLEVKTILEKIGLPHSLISNEFIVIEKEDAQSLALTLNIESNPIKLLETFNTGDTIEIINSISIFKLMDKSGTFIGARMGRPEKSKMRKLTGSPQVLFPVGQEGGRLRSFQASLETGKIRGDFPIYFCSSCDKETIFPICESCKKETKQKFYCKICGLQDSKECKTHGDNFSHKTRDIDINHYFKMALKNIGELAYPDLIKGVRGTSNKDHIPERIEKGILRSKHNIYVNKDGTTRYDMSELPITHFKPKEIMVSIEKLKSLGYSHDMKGKVLESNEQILELRPQDVILPGDSELINESALDVLTNVSKFIDELLEKFYGLPKFYNIKSKDDLIGQLVIGLAPHTSAGTVGRIIGFSRTQTLFAHPLFHAAMRRDCDGDEACVMLLMDAFLNFSRQFLPDRRGGRTMDSPLVLTTKIIPTEVDDMVHGLDVQFKYHLDFYEAALEYKWPWEVSVEQLKSRLETEKQYESIGFTHDLSDLNMGVRCSAYKILPTMKEKLNGQIDLAEKISAVDLKDVIELIINKHFLKDIKGNLRKFSTQQFRCVSCNEKYRRPPLSGKCEKCSGKIIFTVSKGSIIKYLELSIGLAKKYEISPYLKQTLEILKRQIESIFGRDKDKQVGLAEWC